MATGAVLATALTDHAARAYGLFLNGMDVLKEPAATSRYGVDIGTISVTVNAAGGVSRMKFTIDDTAKLITVADGDTVRFYDLTTGAPLFVGWVEHYHIVPDFGTLARSIVIDAIGPESMLDWAVTTTDLTFPGVSMTLAGMIQGIVANSAGMNEIRAFVDSVNAQGSQELPIGNMASVTVTAPDNQITDVESGTAPWVAGVITGYTNAATLAARAGDAPPGGGANSVTINTTVAADEMVYLPLTGTFLAGVPYSVTFWARYPVIGPQSWVALVGSSATTTDRASLAFSTNLTWTRYSLTWTPTVTRTDAVLALVEPGTPAGGANAIAVDLVTVFSGGGVFIPAGTPVREAIVQAAAACVKPTFLGINVTVDHAFGLRAWAVLPTLTQPSDVTTPITVDQSGVNKPSDESYDVDAAGIVRAVLVIGVDGVPMAIVNDGTGKAGRVAVISDDSIVGPVAAQARGQAYLNDYRVGLRGSLGLEDVASGPTAAVDVLRQIVLTDPSTGGTGTYEISSIGFTYYGTKRDAVVAFGGLPPSGAALIRRLTRDTLS